MTKPKHGGKRKPGPGKRIGRPPSTAKKIPLAIKIDPELRAYLSTRENMTETIETELRDSDDFKTWKANQ